MHIACAHIKEYFYKKPEKWCFIDKCSFYFISYLSYILGLHKVYFFHRQSGSAMRYINLAELRKYNKMLNCFSRAKGNFSAAKLKAKGLFPKSTWRFLLYSYSDEGI